MDFFDMNFSKIFLEKHGEVVYNKIIDEIIKEEANKIDNTSIEIIFKVAFLSFLGIEESQIKNMLDDIYKNNKINVEEILIIHSKSINLIKKYLKLNMEEITNNY